MRGAASTMPPPFRLVAARETGNRGARVCFHTSSYLAGLGSTYSVLPMREIGQEALISMMLISTRALAWKGQRSEQRSIPARAYLIV
eukprot:365707-Chlamydomonas_euryale.AAC.30